MLGKREGVVQISIHWLGLMQHWLKAREDVVSCVRQPPASKEKEKTEGETVHGPKKKKKKDKWEGNIEKGGNERLEHLIYSTF